jgi:MFS family permease
MKLNYKRTIFVGFAFFLISMFWSAYDSIIPLILTNKFGMSQTWSGVIMALDNILAVFLLPVFGALSDKARFKRGKRTPFITVGTILASIFLLLLTFADSAQLKNIDHIAAIDDSASLEIIYDAQKDNTLITPEGDEFVLSEKYNKEEFVSIKSTFLNEDGKEEKNPDYVNYVTPARQACAAQVTKESPAPLITFVALLLGVLISMSIFRSPAVALMPDVTIKPLRSKGNAIINLMGTAGGILALVLGIVFATSAVKNSMMSYTLFFSVIALIMLAALVVFLCTVREKKWAQDMQDETLRLGLEDEEKETDTKRKLGRSEMWSLICILASIALWYFGYNAVTSKYSVYATNILQKNFNTTMLLAQGAAIVAYIPAGLIASKIGRKKTILGGVVLLGVAFGVASCLRASSPDWLMNLLFILAGIAWATINVNSFPMVVELCSGGDVGKYTGYYYTASMAAQTATPMLSGFLMDQMGMTVLFPYATIFVGLAFVTMLLVKHGDCKVEAKSGLEALDVD